MDFIIQNTLEFVIFFAGVIVNIIFYYLGLWDNKKNKTKTDLLLNIEEFVPILSTGREIQFLDLKDYNATLNNNVYYLIASLVNIGDNDIPAINIYKNFSISFPIEYKVSKVSAYVTTEGIDPVTELRSNEIQLSWKLLKRAEKIKLEIIIETLDSSSLDDIKKIIEPNINHRIENVQKIKINSINTQDKERLQSRKPYLNFVMLILIGMICFISYRTFSYNSSIKPIIKIELSRNNEGIVSDLKYYNDSVASYQLNKQMYFVKYEEIPRLFEIVTTKQKHYRSYALSYYFAFLLILAFQLSIRSNRRLRKIKIVEPD